MGPRQEFGCFLGLNIGNLGKPCKSVENYDNLKKNGESSFVSLPAIKFSTC